MGMSVSPNILPTMGSLKYGALLLALFASLAECQRRGGRRQFQRRGRQEAGDGYVSPGDAPPPTYGDVPVYGAASDAVPVYGGEQDPALEALASNIPGVPGEDYPIYAEVPETAFSCDGQVDGGYYSDPEAECQAFHICTADGAGGLAKYSFLCPNGTLFNQNYFICDWWFNFDCATAEDLYSLNDEIAAERDALAGASDQAQYGASASEYAAPVPPPPADYEEYPTEAADYSYDAAYDTSYDDAALAGYEETTLPAVESYLPPGDARRGRRFGGGSRRAGRRGGRRNQRRPSGRRSFRG